MAVPVVLSSAPSMSRLFAQAALTARGRGGDLPATHLAAARAAFPEAETHLFADTGHMPQIERADDFADLTRLFVAAHPSPV